ncbi:MAG: bifunctional diaminohydroxyphosphoribosylaminopyrimidine deaminase/5-amino-6-(5-phosphoribosylamino)uracil reductase RibD [Planctomycetota bacterium]
MQQALELASRAGVSTLPNPRVGALVVKGGTIVGSGFHRRYGALHAEAEALRTAGHRAQGATLYCTLEPCSHEGKQPPCTRAIVQAGIKAVVFAQRDPHPGVGGAKVLRKAGIKVRAGFMSREAIGLNPGFNRFWHAGLPYVGAKVATSLDGMMALQSGGGAITGAVARRHGRLLRSRHQAVITGIGTVLVDDPRLTTRIPGERNPAKIILDSHLQIPIRARCLVGGETHVFTTRNSLPRRRRELESHGVTIHLVGADSRGHCDLSEVLGAIGSLGYLEVLLEAGPRLTMAFLEGGWVQDIHWFLSPRPMGQGLVFPMARILPKLMPTARIELVGKDLLIRGAWSGI